MGSLLQTSVSDTIIARNFQENVKSDNNRSFLVKIYPPGPRINMIPLPRARFIIGRGPGCDFDAGDSLVSRHHAMIQHQDGEFKLTDLNSTNGSFVNDVRIENHVLKPGDLIRVGSSIIKFLASSHVEAQYYEAIYQMMVFDGLTGAHNKRFFTDVLERELARSFRHQRPLSLIMFDLDHFKKINDTYGHLVGDAVLRELGARINNTVRKEEVFSRFGGEEFAIILPEADFEEAKRFGERLRALIADVPFVLDDQSISVTISVGVASADGHQETDPTELIERADQKLYQAKANGRNRVAS